MTILEISATKSERLNCPMPTLMNDTNELDIFLRDRELLAVHWSYPVGDQLTGIIWDKMEAYNDKNRKFIS